MDSSIRQELKEDRIHGDHLFPLGLYWMDMEPGEPVLTCHWHEEAEFFYVKEGSALFQVDTDYFPVHAGEAVFIHSGELHAAHALNEHSACTFCAVVFDTNLLASGSYDILQANYIVPLQEKIKTLPRHFRGSALWEEQILGYLQNIIAGYEQREPGFELSIKAYLYLILAQVASGSHWMNRPRNNPSDVDKVDRLKAVMNFVQNRYASVIRIKDLADVAHMSEGQFCRFFKTMTRKTPVQYINYYRINQALAPLRQTDRKIHDVAMEVGFENLSYFIKVFSAQMSCTPSAYRRMKG
jgi:AraC-like DNA-binding protein/mannose-6-phosphate isomerase-like protein (cupin superfamily)